MVLNSEILMNSDGQRVPRNQRSAAPEQAPFPGRFWSHFKTLSCVVVEPAVVIPMQETGAAGLRPLQRLVDGDIFWWGWMVFGDL